MSDFMFPSEEDITFAWEKQKHSKFVSFRCRGMNDAGCLLLLDKINEEKTIKREIDLSLNGITNRCIPKLLEISKSTPKQSFILDQNKFQLDKLSTECAEFVISCLIETKEPTIINRSSTLILSTGGSSGDFVENLNSTAASLAEASKILDKLENSVESIKQNNFDKIFGQLEQKVNKFLETTLNVREITQDEKRVNLASISESLEVDGLLYCESSDTIYAVETTHDLNLKTFSQLSERSMFLEINQLEGNIVGKFQKSKIVLVAAAEIVIDTMETIAKTQKVILVKSNLNNNAFSLFDYSK